MEADHASLPRVIYQGGPLVTAPQLVTVTFRGDSMAGPLEAFGAGLASSSWWTSITEGYCGAGGGGCIGAGGSGTAVVVEPLGTSTIADTDLQQWLVGQIQAGILPSVAAPADAIYVVYLPATTTINYAGGTSCIDFDSYHGTLTMGARPVRYAVVSECPQSDGTVALSQLTTWASHEVAEVATDPDAPSAVGYYLDLSDPDSDGWNDMFGGEVADLCLDPFGLQQDITIEGDFAVQKIWSVAQAASGADPCRPIDDDAPYFNVAPDGARFTVAVGGSVTFRATAFSSAPMDDWSLSVVDASRGLSGGGGFLAATITTGGGAPATRVSANNGTEVEITVTLVADPSGAPSGEAVGALVSTAGAPDHPSAARVWPFAVVSAAVP